MNYKDILDFLNLLLYDKVSFTNKWDMEQCLKVYKIKKFNKTPNKDPEWVYMLNRFEYLNKLIISYQITHDKKYIDKYYEMIERWNKENYKYIVYQDIYHKNKVINFYRKVIKKICSHLNVSHIFINHIRTLDTAIRCFSLTNDMIYIKNNKLLFKYYNLKDNIIKQLEFVKNEHHISHDYDNWGLLECIYSLYSLIAIDSVNIDLYKFNDNKYKKLLKKQILDDGTQVENTPLYHVQIFIALSHLLNIKKFKKIKISNYEISVYKKMADYIYMVSDLQNNIINYGDSDITNISDVMYISYLILDDKKYLEKINNELDKCFLSRFTYDINYELNNIKKYQNKYEKELYKDSKNIIIKDNKRYLFVTNNDNITSHRHIDLGSFVYSSFTPLFVDSGRYTYNYNRYRKYLKSQFAHNTLYMDKRVFAKIRNTWKTENYIDEAKIDFTSKNIIYIFIKSKDIIYERYFVLIDEGLVIINIIVNNDNKKHNSVRNYILDDKVIVEKSNIYKLINDKKKIYLYTNSNSIKPKKCVISKKYNELIKTNKLILKNSFKNKSISFDLMLDKKCNVKFYKDSCSINDKKIIIKDNSIELK